MYSIQHSGKLVLFSGTPVSSTNKTDCHDKTELLLNVAINTIIQTSNHDALTHVPSVGQHVYLIRPVQLAEVHFGGGKMLNV